MILNGMLLFAYFLACGYGYDDSKILQLNEFLDDKKATKIDLNTMLMILTQLKELELMNEADNDADEYCNFILYNQLVDAFVALGG